MHLAQERTAPQALHGERAGVVAEIERQDGLQAGVAQHLHQALQHLAWRLRGSGQEGVAGRGVAHHQPDGDGGERGEDDGGAEHGAPADGLRGPGQRGGGGQVAEQADGQDHGGEGGEAVRREPAGDHHHAADEHDAEAGAHQHAAGQQDRPGRRQGEDDAADGGEDEHADHGTARAVTVEEEAAGDLHGGEAEEEGARKPAQGFRPDGQVAHQVQADGDVGGAEEMAGDVGSGQCRDDDQAPAVGERAPLGGLHRWGDVPLIVENCSAGVLSG